MAAPTILRLNFVKVLEEVARGLQLVPPIFSVTANSEGTGSKGAVYLQLRAQDPGSFSSFYGNAECPRVALQYAAYLALQHVIRSNHVAFVDVNLAAYWKQMSREAKREQEHQQAMAQLQLYHETRRKRKIQDLRQEYARHIFKVEQDLKGLLEEERGKTKKLNLEVKNLEARLKECGDQINGLLTENMNLRLARCSDWTGDNEEQEHSTIRLML